MVELSNEIEELVAGLDNMEVKREHMDYLKYLDACFDAYEKITGQKHQYYYKLQDYYYEIFWERLNDK